MSDVKINQATRQPALTRQGGIPGHARTLQTANREALRHLGWPIDATVDPKGRQLRQLRLQLGIDPALLATHACMSLSQLYELEDGGNSRFYSDSLRRQAGRRVARLLGADWDQMLLDDRHPESGLSNVVPLQRPNTHTAAARHGDPIHSSTEDRLSDLRPAATTPAVDPDAPVSMGLATPATETLVITPKSEVYAAHPGHARKSAGGSPLLTLLVLVALGAAGVYAFNEYSPYRLYWPW
jgi:hypothetical protein